MFFKWADPSNSYRGFAVLPYIKGLTEPLARLLKNNGIPNHKQTPENPTTGICFPQIMTTGLINKQMLFTKIPCADCPWSYIGVILEKLEGA